MPKKIHLLVIDPQKDFCDPAGSLYVKGAENDIERLVKFIHKGIDKRTFDDIHVTMDCHPELHIAHPCAWVDSKGNNPPPFTMITIEDLESGTWNPRNPGWYNLFHDYLTSLREYNKTLGKNSRYPMCLWPPHCIIGDQGGAFVDEFSKAIRRWEHESIAIVNRVTKGSNWKTEHFSALKADVPDPKDPSTQLNVNLLQSLENADAILITGEALSHCVANTVLDIADNFSDDSVGKFILLEDTTSPVVSPDAGVSAHFKDVSDDFVQRMIARGMQVTTTEKFWNE